MPKGRKLDLIVRQATEAGVRRIIPLESDHSISRRREPRGNKGDSHEEPAHKTERLRRIARQAMQQSGASLVPEILDPIPFQQLSCYWDGDGIGLYFHEVRLEETSLHGYLAETDGPIAICIGPEGGFSDVELHYLDTYGFKPVFLPVNVLRTETAALYALAAVQTVIMERKHWKSS